MNDKQIAEALKLQSLSEEEKASRHILGRLYGPIATCLESTRNGRKYNRQLWETALEDELFAEKLNNKCLFLELGHPADRSETDMREVCACIPEMPKIINGDLYAYVDILDTPNGRILKTLCDYGFVPGISSRGQGDIMANNEVDPDTFTLECWDIVGIPAVKKARMAVCESLDVEEVKMKKALMESIEQANEEDKEIMKESLNKLNITLEEASDTYQGGTPKDVDLIPVLDEDSLDESKEVLTEETEEEEVEEIEIPEDSIEAELTADLVDETDEKVEEKEKVEEEPVAEEHADSNTVEEFIKNIQGLEFKEGAKIITAPIELEGKTYETDLIVDKDDNGDLLIGVNCTLSEKEEDSDNIEVASEETEEIKADDESKSVEDNEENELIEQLMETVRQKDKLETELKTLKSEKTVGDSKVEKLEEELKKYKSAFERVSTIAATNNKKSAQKVKELTEQLTQKDREIKDLKHTHQVSLNEGLQESVNRSNKLTEELKVVQEELKETKAQLTEQIESYKTKAIERTKVAKHYKEKFNEALTTYVNHRASLLGVKPSEITNKLKENYTIADVDSVCESLLTENLHISKLPFGLTKSSKVVINENKTTKRAQVSDGGYEIDDDLLELAGLK